METYERLFANRDIVEQLNVNEHVATLFLKEFGCKVGTKRVITQPEFRRLQMDGTVAEWMKTAPRA